MTAEKFSDTKKGSACPFSFFISVVSSWYPLKEPKRNHCCENIKFDTYVLNIGECVNLRLCINATRENTDQSVASRIPWLCV